MAITAWAAVWGDVVHEWPATSGELFDAVQAAPPGTVFLAVPGVAPLNPDDPGTVFEWWCQVKGSQPDAMLRWEWDDRDEWDGVTVE